MSSPNNYRRHSATMLLLALAISATIGAASAVAVGGRRALLQQQQIYGQPAQPPSIQSNLTPGQLATAIQGAVTPIVQNTVQNTYGQAQPYQQQQQQQGQQQPVYIQPSQQVQSQPQAQQSLPPTGDQQGAAFTQASVAPSTGPASPQPTSSAGASTAAGAGGSDILSLHNQYRSHHHAGALSWSSSLEASAQSWANRLASSCGFYHSGTQGVGENLAAGQNNWAEVAAAWYNEINQYNYASTGFSEATGHATQVLWLGTTELGCATAASSGGCWERTVYVCHYNPPGNVIGQFPQNVLAP